MVTAACEGKLKCTLGVGDPAFMNSAAAGNKGCGNTCITSMPICMDDSLSPPPPPLLAANASKAPAGNKTAATKLGANAAYM